MGVTPTQRNPIQRKRFSHQEGGTQPRRPSAPTPTPPVQGWKAQHSEPTPSPPLCICISTIYLDQPLERQRRGEWELHYTFGWPTPGELTYQDGYLRRCPYRA